MEVGPFLPGYWDHLVELPLSAVNGTQKVTTLGNLSDEIHQTIGLLT